MREWRDVYAPPRCPGGIVGHKSPKTGMQAGDTPIRMSDRGAAMTTSLRRTPTNKIESDQRLEKCAEKHNRLRRLARNQLEEEIQRAFGGLKISAEPIGERALGQVDMLWTPNGRRERFDWRGIMRILEKSHPRRFDVSLWHDGNLCGLAAARLADNKGWLSLTYLEGAPFAHKLKRRVAPVALVGAEIYATLIAEEDANGRLPQLRVLNPLLKSIPVYAASGYSSFHKANGYTFVTV